MKAGDEAGIVRKRSRVVSFHTPKREAVRFTFAKAVQVAITKGEEPGPGSGRIVLGGRPEDSIEDDVIARTEGVARRQGAKAVVIRTPAGTGTGTEVVPTFGGLEFGHCYRQSSHIVRQGRPFRIAWDVPTCGADSSHTTRTRVA